MEETDLASAVTDTAMWRLVVEISDNSLNAWLRKTEDSDASLRSLANASWDSNDVSLRNIENAVYDNPAILDDIEADIVLYTDRHILLPTQLADDEEIAHQAFELIFGETPQEDIFVDTIDSRYSCIYAPVSGLKAFLRRTFAGARTTCHITPWIKHCIAIQTQEPKLFITWRSQMLDLLLTNQGQPISVSTRKVCEAEEVLYHIANACKAANIDTTQVIAVTEPGSDIAQLITPYMSRVETLALQNKDVAPAVSLLAFRNKK